MMSKRNKKAKSQSFKVPNLPQHLQHINLNAAGIDIGSERHLVAVPAGRDTVSVREFGSFTADLQERRRVDRAGRRFARGQPVAHSDRERTFGIRRSSSGAGTRRSPARVGRLRT